MTRDFSKKSTEKFGELKEFTSELIARIAGQKIVSAKPANNLIYRPRDETKSESIRCGLLIETESGVKLGLFRWDIMQCPIAKGDKPLSKELSDCLLKQAAQKAFATANDEESWLKAIADEIIGKTCSLVTYIGEYDGRTFNGVAFKVVE